MARPLQRGFTLIEIMVVVAIIGILAAVAYPSYIDSVRRSARADAQSDLMQIAQTAERFFTLNNRYDQTRVAPPAPFVLPMNQSPRSGGARYNINIAFPTTQTYVLQAVPAGSQVGDVCGTLAVNEAGATTPELGTDGRACW